MKPLKIIVLAKQVPDTRNVGKDAMKADGTVNRAALEAIFNPEDLNALEQALRMKERVPGSTVSLLTMGPGRAADVIREGLYRGADGGILLTDRKFAGSDTLATSYAISMAVKKMEYDIIIAGRQAIDGDTAQVGPQVAEKLQIPQVTYVEEIEKVDKGYLTIRRRLDNGVEHVKTPFPALLTVHSSASDCRPRIARNVMKYKHARTLTELQDTTEDYTKMFHDRPYLKIREMGVEEIGADVEALGLSGSPTKVKKIESVVFKAKEAKVVQSEDKDIEKLIVELIENHTIG
ncbi:MAG: electron transfer flavoprotein subunit beta/FixA family protein [Bacteroidales bacterium]|nr:electron transfer flavoprotein subunit beta/FixA family protein [Bacteroidales bacterium]